MLTQINSRYKLFIFLYDCVIIILSAFFAPIFRSSAFSPDYYVSFFDIHLYFILAIYCIILYIFDLYNIKFRQSRIQFLIIYTAAFLLIAILLATFFYIFPKISFGRGIWLIQIGLSYVS
jgi:FlaA1/EpsC-like NDP-sugar epimerase